MVRHALGCGTEESRLCGFALAPDGQFYLLQEARKWTLLVLYPAFETQAELELDLDLGWEDDFDLLAVGHTAAATNLGFCCRFTGMWTHRFPPDFGSCDWGTLCFMPVCGHFARKRDAGIDVYDGAGTGHMLRRIAVQAPLARVLLIRASEADEFVLAADEPPGADEPTGPNLVLCDGDGILQRKLSYCFFGDLCVRGGKVYAQLSCWYWDVYDVNKSLTRAVGFRFVME